ncbi:MAG: ATP-dependent Clp protease proteolytic subunit [Actinomycetota bacterium]|jgi:ATP-dependent Clp protease protease subunit|nr:ATP-dependent Clp protease proteolytic subunit [Actinomycetota bacterium]
MRGPDDWTEPGDWLEGHLFDRRTLVLRGPLDDARATRVAAQLMTLDATGDDAVHIQLDCAGGSLEAAFAVADVIDALGVPVHVTCLGRVEGVAALVAAVCGHRRTAEHTTFRLQDPDAAIEGRSDQLESLVAYHSRSYARYHERLAAASGRPVEVIAQACAAGRYMSAADAVAFGLIDEVVRSGRAPVRPLPRSG